MMRIRKGLPPGYMKIDEELRTLIGRLHQLDQQDVHEVAAFIDYLHNGVEQLKGQERKNGGNLKLYDFVEGGIGNDNVSADDSEQYR